MPPPEPATAPVFVCYSHRDLSTVDRVVAELEQRGHVIWIDRSGIVGSETWRAKIVNALRASGAVLFFGSKSSFTSKHVATELTLAEESQTPIVPVLLDDAFPEGDIAYFLARRHRLRLDGPGDQEGLIQIDLALSSITRGATESSAPARRRSRQPSFAMTFLAGVLLSGLAGGAWWRWREPTPVGIPAPEEIATGTARNELAKDQRAIAAREVKATPDAPRAVPPVVVIPPAETASPAVNPPALPVEERPPGRAMDKPGSVVPRGPEKFEIER